jgi:hypothetical protein
MPFVDTATVEPRTPLPAWSGRFVHSEHMTFVYWNVEDGVRIASSILSRLAGRDTVY